MEIRVDVTPLSRAAGKAVLLFATKGQDLSALVRQAGRGFAAPYRLLERRQTFTGAAGQVAVLHDAPGARFETLVLAGLGDGGKDTDVLRTAAAEGARAARDAGADRLTLALPVTLPPFQAAETVVEGVRMGLYVFEAYKTEKAKRARHRGDDPRAAGEGRRASDGASRRGRSSPTPSCSCATSATSPGNTCTPTYLAMAAQKISTTYGVGLHVLERRDMEALGMGSLLGVARGSAQPPKLIVLTYEPKKARGRVDTVAIVGKGLTFDSGGISIKPAEKMEDMKFDMCGGGAVLGVMQAVARLKLPVRVVGLVPASENMPDADAYKPGDILKAMNGVTIEIVNTDAEGRLILADALRYATTQAPSEAEGRRRHGDAHRRLRRGARQRRAPAS